MNAQRLIVSADRGKLSVIAVWKTLQRYDVQVSGCKAIVDAQRGAESLIIDLADTTPERVSNVVAALNRQPAPLKVMVSVAADAVQRAR
ncbi:hypothetical protein PXJ20_10455 [Paraburkholderia sp. A1RI_3L]|uniref:hypothetical protein n=1 Tax=Paraburkholderia TaxID=1822464 RepID=UPI000A95A648|nr:MULTISPECIES: hypothetical protein [Paraburkholderia]WEY37559.1 hypothetical protein P2869_10695 [Paraburkholderia sp. SUR17]